MITDTMNPYVGLRPFEMDESLMFFGRNDQTLELLQLLHLHHFVAVVGSSGSGKSSLLRAGLIPSLKAGYLVQSSDHWCIAIMKPGQSPLFNLAESILLQVNPTANAVAISNLVLAIKEEGVDALVNIMSPLWKEENVNFFLLVDQFEELFRFAMDQKDGAKKDVAKKDEAIDFVNIILELTKQTEVPVYVVITMRSDFIGDCVQFYGLPEAMNKSLYLVPRINRLQLKAVIEGPAKLFGKKVNPVLTSLLLNELGKVTDELPLLQHALMRIWDANSNDEGDNELDIKDYKSIGGFENALSFHAEEALDITNEEYLVGIKKMFQALTTIDSNGRKIRRPVLLSQLKVLTGMSTEKLLNIIQLFNGDKRSFLVINSVADSDDKVIDISHESLIRQWKTLDQWVDEEAESVTTYLQLAEAAKLHKQKRKDYLSGSELQIVDEWRTKFKPSAVWANRYKEGFDEIIHYLDESVADANRKKKWMEYLKIGTVGIVVVLLVFLIYNKTNELKEVKRAKDEVHQRIIENAKLRILLIDSVKATLDSLNNQAKDLKARVATLKELQNKLNELQDNEKKSVKLEDSVSNR